MLSRVMLALRRAKVPQKHIDRFMQEATIRGTAEAIHTTCARWVTVQ
jgi:hypothetical protein